MNREAKVAVFDAFEAENRAEYRRRARMTPTERCRELAALQDLTVELPGHLHDRLHGFASEVRSEYRTLIVGTWITTFLAAMIIFALFVRPSWQRSKGDQS